MMASLIGESKCGLIVGTNQNSLEHVNNMQARLGGKAGASAKLAPASLRIRV